MSEKSIKDPNVYWYKEPPLSYYEGAALYCSLNSKLTFPLSHEESERMQLWVRTYYPLR
jgi:hypothetical protein